MYDAAFNNIENILRAEDGIANELDYVEQMQALSFNTQTLRHELSQLYETRIRRMGNAGQ